MTLNFVNKMKLISSSLNLAKNVRTCRNYFNDSQNGLREFNIQLSKFNGNDGDYESKIKAAQLVALAIQTDEKLSLNNTYLSERNRKMILYNVTGGRYWRLKICYNAYRSLAPKSMLTDEHLLRISILGYLIEQYISAYIILDDITDGAELRRNKPSWYRKVGMTHACTDAALMLHGVLIVLKQILKHHSGYERCIEILNEFGMWESVQAQILDRCLTNNQCYFNWETYEKLAFSKMAGNCFYCPLMMAMTMANHDFTAVYDKLANIMNEMGIWILMENDYQDRYGNRTGKNLDEDIKNGTLTWMILKAIEYANSDQEKVLRECYGKRDTQSIQAVIDVYEQIKIKQIAEAFRKESYKNIEKSIIELPDRCLQNSLLYPLQIISKWYTT